MSDSQTQPPAFAVGDRVRLVAPGTPDHGLVGTVVEVAPTFAAGLANPWPYRCEFTGVRGGHYTMRLGRSELMAMDGEGAAR